MSRAERAVVLFAKWPDGGRAKRRLGRAVGRERAECLARSFLDDTVTLIARSGADRLVIAVSTVKWYVNAIYGKLQVESRTKAIARARELNIV